MISFLLTTKRLVTAFFRAFRDKEFQALFFISLITLVSGTLFYSSVEGWRIIDALYFCVTTLTTVGNSNLVPQSDFAKVFTMIYLFVGVGIMLGFVKQLAFHISVKKE